MKTSPSNKGRPQMHSMALETKVAKGTILSYSLGDNQIIAQLSFPNLERFQHPLSHKSKRDLP